MKFIINHIHQNARTGLLKEIERLPGVLHETPMLFHYTKGANLPHITRDVFEMITENPQAISVSLSNTVTFMNSLEEFKEGIAKFAAMEDCLTYLCLQDTGIKSVEGRSDKNFIPLWTRHGKILLDPIKYIDIISKFKPDIYHTLCDGDTGPHSTEKHLLKAVEKSNKMFNECMELHVGNKWLRDNCFVLGAISGGYSIEHRKNSLKHILNSKYISNINGILIDGLQANGPYNENLNNSKLYEIVENVISDLPTSLLRSVSGSFPPNVILKLISLGVDIFDTSYASNVTERNCALTLNLDVEDMDTPEINLEENKYKEDFTPLLKGCKCLTCVKHTKAYINHLIATRELLGQILLSIHNTHSFLIFFQVVREYIKENKLNILINRIKKQYKST